MHQTGFVGGTKSEGQRPLAKDTSSDNPLCAVCCIHLSGCPTKIRLLQPKTELLESAPCGITHTWASTVQAGMQFGNTDRIRSPSSHPEPSVVFLTG